MSFARRIRLACWVVVALGNVVESSAASPRRGDTEGGRIILYSEADFRGDSLVLYPGDRIEDFARQPFDSGQPSNDRISSIAIEGQLEITLYADGRFQGDVLRLTDSVSNLSDLDGPSRRANWNDWVSSATVTARAGRPPRRPGPGRPERQDRVELYSDANYRGSRLVLYPGDRLNNLGDEVFEDGARVNDQISSIRISGRIGVIGYENGEFGGKSTRIDTSVPNLATHSGGANGRTWNDTISALVVTEQNQRGYEDVVRRAYRDLLGREPDTEGLASYVRAMEERGMSEAEMRQHIRRGREFRERDAVALVRRAYRDLLRREPDVGGEANYVRLVLDEGWSEARVREALRASDEFRQRQTNGK